MEEQRILEIIRRNPGINVYRIAKMIDKRGSTVMNALITLERRGVLIAEDRFGGLSEFRKVDD